MKYKFIHLIESTAVRTTAIIDFNEFDKDQTLEKKFIDFKENETNVSFQIK